MEKPYLFGTLGEHMTITFNDVDVQHPETRTCLHVAGVVDKRKALNYMKWTLINALSLETKTSASGEKRYTCKMIIQGVTFPGVEFLGFTDESYPFDILLGYDFIGGNSLHFTGSEKSVRLCVQRNEILKYNMLYK